MNHQTSEGRGRSPDDSQVSNVDMWGLGGGGDGGSEARKEDSVEGKER